jgi:hypothetical protein
MIELTWQGKQEAIEEIIARDGDACFICKGSFGKKEKKTLDHWIPLSKGGTWNISNLRLAHRQCNFWKSDRMPLEDGTIPEKPVKKSSIKKVKKHNRPKICGSCMSGRLVNHGQKCSVCRSGPQPEAFPGWAKKKTVECDHTMFHCFACILGFVKRSA